MGLFERNGSDGKMKRIFMAVILCLCVLLCASCGKESLTKKCMELDCDIDAKTVDYCGAHLRVYEYEREFYPIVKSVIERIEAQPVYATSATFRIEEVIVHYVNAAREPYRLDIYCHYMHNEQHYFSCYSEGDKRFGEIPENEACTAGAFSSACATAYGENDAYPIKLRTKHYAQKEIKDSDCNVYFSINFEDMKKQMHK